MERARACRSSSLISRAAMPRRRAMRRMHHQLQHFGAVPAARLRHKCDLRAANDSTFFARYEHGKNAGLNLWSEASPVVDRIGRR